MNWMKRPMLDDDVSYWRNRRRKKETPNTKETDLWNTAWDAGYQNGKNTKAREEYQRGYLDGYQTSPTKIPLQGYLLKKLEVFRYKHLDTPEGHIDDLPLYGQPGQTITWRGKTNAGAEKYYGNRHLYYLETTIEDPILGETRAVNFGAQPGIDFQFYSKE